MVQGKDRRVELGYHWALQCRKQIVYPPKNKNSRYNVNQNNPNQDVEKFGEVEQMTVTASA